MELGPNSYQLGTKHVIYQKVADFMYKEDVYIKRLKRLEGVNVYFTEQSRTKCKGGF